MSLFREISGFDTVQVFDGAEFSKKCIPKSGKTAILLISQSGETKDLHRCIDIAKDNNLFMIGVINVVDSLIAREVHCGVYLNAGREFAVASTKAFTSQVIVLYLIAVWFAELKNINELKRHKIIDDLRRLPLDIKNTIHNSHDLCKSIAKYLVDYNSIFILGKDNCEHVAKEGALKLKEIGYIHAEGYSSSSLKHGSYALITSGYPVLIISPNDKHFARNSGIANELKSRNAYLIGISDIDIDSKYDVQIKVPNNDTFVGLLSNMVQQLISYELAILKGHNPDYPRNLAKVITVD